MWPMGCWDACSWFFDVEVKKNKATREKWRFSGVSPLTTGEPREVYPSYTFRRPSTFYYIELPNPPSGPMTELPPYPSCNAIWVCGPRFPNALPLKHFLAQNSGLFCNFLTLGNTVRFFRLLYTVSTKKVTPCMHCHNSDKQCQILTEFWTDNEMSNCKQITKFK